jgi:hypothetical protein
MGRPTVQIASELPGRYLKSRHKGARNRENCRSLVKNPDYAQMAARVDLSVIAWVSSIHAAKPMMTGYALASLRGF